jgi:hypothetical protein
MNEEGFIGPIQYRVNRGTAIKWLSLLENPSWEFDCAQLSFVGTNGQTYGSPEGLLASISLPNPAIARAAFNPGKGRQMSKAPHCQAGFINAIREEGTHEDACDWLQKTWNELMQAKKENARLRAVDAKTEKLYAAWQDELKNNYSDADNPEDRGPDDPRSIARTLFVNALIEGFLARAAFNPGKETK